MGIFKKNKKTEDKMPEISQVETNNAVIKDDLNSSKINELKNSAAKINSSIKEISASASALVSSTESQNSELRSAKSMLSNFSSNMEDLAINITNVHIKVLDTDHLADTGLNTMTGGRIKRIKNYIGNETFMLTYGDGVGDVNIQNLLFSFSKSFKNSM